MPAVMSGELAYTIGVLIGDGYLSRPAKRKSHGAGYYWRVTITGPLGYLTDIKRIFAELFRLDGHLARDRRKRKAWQLRFGSLALHRFLARVIGIPQGKKTAGPSWSRFNLVKEFPIHFLTGLIDSDGYIGSRYIAIVQKDLGFLLRVKEFAAQEAGIIFRGPYVNRRIGGEVVGWMISIYGRAERTRLIRDIAEIHLGTKKESKPL